MLRYTQAMITEVVKMGFTSQVDKGGGGGTHLWWLKSAPPLELKYPPPLWDDEKDFGVEGETTDLTFCVVDSSI